MAIADLLELSSEDTLATRLGESRETISRWRAARAVPEAKVSDLIDWALLEGHVDAVTRVASAAAPLVFSTAGLLHDLGQSWSLFHGRPGVDPSGASAEERDLPLTRIMEEMQSHRVFTGDPVERVRALRAEWDWRGEFDDRIRSGGD